MICSNQQGFLLLSKQDIFVVWECVCPCDGQLCLTGMYIWSHFLRPVKENPVARSHFYFGMHLLPWLLFKDVSDGAQMHGQHKELVLVMAFGKLERTQRLISYGMPW